MKGLAFLNHLQQLIHAFNWHTPSWDLFIMLFWLVAGVVYAFAAGRGRIMTILVSVYMAKLLIIEAPFLTTEVSKHSHIAVASLQQLATFAILFLVLFLFLGRYAFKTSADSRRMSSILFGTIFGILQVGLLINVVIGFLPDAARSGMNPLIRFIFVDNPASFVWLVAPVLFLVFLGKFISERSEM